MLATSPINKKIDIYFLFFFTNVIDVLVSLAQLIRTIHNIGYRSFSHESVFKLNKI